VIPDGRVDPTEAAILGAMALPGRVCMGPTVPTAITPMRIHTRVPTAIIHTRVDTAIIPTIAATDGGATKSYGPISDH